MMQPLIMIPMIAHPERFTLAIITPSTALTAMNTLAMINPRMGSVFF